MRGGAEQFIEETERSLHDAIMIVRRAVKNDAIVAGGGAIEMEISKYLRDYSRSIAGKEQMIISALARSFEIIPRQLCENAGFDATDILNKLRQKHSEGHIWFGVDINKEDINNENTDVELKIHEIYVDNVEKVIDKEYIEPKMKNVVYLAIDKFIKNKKDW